MKTLYFIFITLLLFSCSKPIQNSEVIFTRQGILVTHSKLKELQFKRIVPQHIGQHTFFRYSWEAQETISFELDGKRKSFVAPQNPEPYLLAQIPLENADKLITAGNSPDTDIRFSPDNQVVAIGTYFGSLRVYSLNEGKLLWMKHIAEGMVKSLIFSADSKTLIVGEQSVDGNIYGFDVNTSERKWTYRLSEDLEQSAPPRSEDRYGLYTLPAAYHMKQTSNGDILIAALHSWQKNGAQMRSKMYRFTPEGKKVWEFPRKTPLHGNIKFFDATDDYIVFNIDQVQHEFIETDPIKEKSIALLSTEKGELLDQTSIPVLKPYFKSVYFWQSASISRDGAFAILGSFDGRGFVLPIHKNRFASIISRELGKPILINDIPITAGIPFTASIGEHGIFSIAQTSIPYSISSEKNITTPPSIHPAAGNIVAVNSKGETVWKYHDGLIYSMPIVSENQQWMMVTLDQKKENEDLKTFGFTLFRKKNDTYTKTFQYKTKTAAFFRGALSQNGELIGVTQVPSLSSDKKTIEGAYSVHIVM